MEILVIGTTIIATIASAFGFVASLIASVGALLFPVSFFFYNSAKPKFKPTQIAKSRNRQWHYAMIKRSTRLALNTAAFASLVFVALEDKGSRLGNPWAEILPENSIYRFSLGPPKLLPILHCRQDGKSEKLGHFNLSCGRSRS